MTTITISITQTSEIESPAILLRELAQMIIDMKDGELNRLANNIGGEYSDVKIDVRQS